MYHNHLLFALRRLKSRKTATFISALGLVVGIVSFLFILEYAAFEFSVNSFHKHAENIYRVVVADENGEFSTHLAPGVAGAARENLAGVLSATRYADGICDGVITINSNQQSVKAFRESSCFYTDESFLNMFTFNLEHGNGDLSEPGTAVITSSQALKYFGEENVTGREFTLDNQFGKTDYRITGVLEDNPENSDISFELLLSFVTLENPANQNGNDWVDPTGLNNGFTQNFIQLADGVSSDEVSQSFNELKSQIRTNDTSVINLQKLSDIHLAPSLGYSLPTSGSLVQVLLVLMVAAMIMIVAWANYINLMTAQGLERAKQIGVQKTLGATRRQLVLQFLGETFLFSLLCIGIAFMVVEISQPSFNQLIGKEVSLANLNFMGFWVAGAIFFLIGILAAGGYIAFVLTSYKPDVVLKGSFTSSKKGIKVRQGLVVFQFAVSILFIITTLVFNEQLSYMRAKNLGIELEDRLVIRGPATQNSNTDNGKSGSSFKDELAQLSFVKSYTGSSSIPGNGYFFFAARITNLNPEPGDEKKSYGILPIDQNYLHTYQIELLKGKNFTKEAIDLGWGERQVILNETAALELGFDPAISAVDNEIKWGQFGTYDVIGVVRDYHHLSLQEKIDPMIFLPLDAEGNFTIHMSTQNISANINRLQSLYSEYFPGNPFEYYFIKDQYDQQYAAELRFENFFTLASLIAIIIACLGLFGLATYTAISRTKEIGVRKVLGASVSGIVLLLSKDFLKLVVIGFVIAAPLAGFAMNKWLQNFAYRTELNIDVFILSALIASAIAILTVSSRAVKAALNNPVESLKNE